MPDIDLIARDPDDGSIDVVQTWQNAEDAVYSADQTKWWSPPAEAEHLLAHLSDDELDSMHEVAKVKAGHPRDGLDPRSVGTQLRGHLCRLHTGRNWLPTFDSEAVMELLADNTAARAVLAVRVRRGRSARRPAESRVA